MNSANNVFFCNYLENNRKYQLTLMIDASNNCQLGCWYCYFGKKDKSNMDVSKVFTGIKNFLPIFGSRLAGVNFHYMGGEPLLAWKEILTLNDLGRGFLEEKGVSCRWSLTSNLIALDRKKTDHMLREKAGIHCSIDGPESIHNKNRPYRTGCRSSFADVAKNVPLALEITPYDTARVTVCPDDVNRMPEIAETILGLGFKIVGLFPAYNMGWTKRDIAMWGESIHQVYEQFFNPNNVMISTIIKPSKKKRNSQDRKFTYCGAGRGLWAIDVHGNLYFCHHFTKMPQYAIIDASSCSTDQIGDAIENSSLPPDCSVTDEVCSDCSARSYCNGGCWTSNFLANGNASVPEKIECTFKRITTEVLEGWLNIEPERRIGTELRKPAIQAAYEKRYHCEHCDKSCDDCQSRCVLPCDGCGLREI